MATVKSPFQQFFDTDGKALDSGFVYVGVAGQNPETNPITLYWDTALTQPVVQPIRTVSGYIARSGTPAQLYTAAGVVDYSMTARNRRGEIIFSELSVSPLAGLQADIAAAIHAAPLDADPSELDELGIWDQFTGALRKITFTFLQSGAGAVLMKLRAALRLSIWVEHYGAGTGASAATNDAAFAAAIAEAVARGGDVVNIGPGTWNLTQITLKTGVHLIGRGSGATKLFQAANSSKHFIITDQFAALTGNNMWFTSEGVPYGFGLDAMTVDGNRANQIAGHGVAIYGKGYTIGYDLKIVNAKEVGFYSECGYKGGQTIEQDMPEGSIGKVQVYKSGKEGFVFRGPHDQPIHDVSVSQAGQDGTYDGVRIEGKLNVFNGLTYVTGSIHAYACTGRGITVNTGLHAAMLTGESNVRDGVVLEAAGETVGHIGAFFCDIDLIEAYKNDTGGTGTYWNVRISGSSAKVEANITVSAAAAGGLRVNGNLNRVIGSVTAANAVAHGIGVLVDTGNYNTAYVTISNFSTAGDIGLRTENIAYSDIRATLFTCQTGWNNNGTSSHNNYNISGFSAAGTGFAQTGTFAGTDVFNVRLTWGGASAVSRYNDVQRSILAGNTSVTITHNAFITPTAGEITITPNMDWRNAGVARTWWIANITGASFDLVTDVAAPAGGLTFYWKLDI